MLKRTIYIIVAITFGVVLLESFMLKRPDGTVPGHTGSPGDSLKNCTVCHGGLATPIDGWITSDIPASGYVPGVTYTITATNTEAEGTRFGFQVSPQNIQGDLLGTIIVSDTVKTQLVGNGKYITYTSNGVDGAGFNTWVFKWKAPVGGTGKVVFYGAFNSNFNGHKDGDKTFLSTLTVNEAGTTGLQSFSSDDTPFVLYPQPASERVFVNIGTTYSGKPSIRLMDINGKTVSELVADETANGILSLSLTDIPRGIYFMELQIDGKQEAVRKLMVN
ncbi:MAG: choice-of-anchor V domain-containing protein [Bacteroidota bacterium]